MRITLGKYKGKIIKVPSGIRPTENKIRKTLFDILGKEIKGAKFLELFAGSGIVGLEAVSLGASSTTFVEKNPRCLKTLKENLKNTLLPNSFSILAMDVFAAIKKLAQKNVKFDIIFLDPPYYPECSYSNKGLFGILKRYKSSHYIRDKNMIKKSLQTLVSCDILANNGFLVAQHFKKDLLPKQMGKLILFKQVKKGDTVLSFYRIGISI